MRWALLVSVLAGLALAAQRQERAQPPPQFKEVSDGLYRQALEGSRRISAHRSLAGTAALAAETLTAAICALSPWLPLCRLQQRLFLLPGLPSIPIMVGLIREGSNWVLVDAGAWDTPRRAHATDLVAALRAVIPAGDKLAAIARELPCKHVPLRVLSMV